MMITFLGDYIGWYPLNATQVLTPMEKHDNEALVKVEIYSF